MQINSNKLSSMKVIKYITVFTVALLMIGCNTEDKTLAIEVFETSEAGHKLSKITEFKNAEEKVVITLNPEEKFQTITGFGGAFTEASAYLLNKLSTENRKKIIDAYFSKDGAHYSLTRTHMNSCDFSLSNYSYTPVEGDKNLEHFSIEEDKDDLIPFIKEAMAASSDGFKIFGSPWTAAPWTTCAGPQECRLRAAGKGLAAVFTAI